MIEGLISPREKRGKKDYLHKYPYRQVLGRLMYLAHISRPDISNAVRELGQQMHDPCLRHWKGLQPLVKYLATFPRMGIAGKKERNPLGTQLKGYADADFAADT